MPNPITTSDPAIRAGERNYRTSDGTELHAYDWTSAVAEQSGNACVVVLHGYAEHAGRYREVAEFLVREGHPVAAFDARGHGRSPGQRGHIDDYARYVDDLYGFVEDFRQRYPNRAVVALGHSNGGLTALRMVQTKPAILDGLIVSCPLVELQPNQKPIPFGIAKLLSTWVGRLRVPSGLRPSDLTHDLEIVQRHRRDPLIHKVSSPRWYVTTSYAMRSAMSDVERVRLPVLVLVAEEDHIVQPSGVKRMFAGLASTDKELIICAGAYHEVLNEVDRSQTYAKIATWLSARETLWRR